MGAFKVSPTEHERLHCLLDHHLGDLTEKQRLQVQRAEAIINGVPVARIAEMFGGKPNTVGNLKTKLDRGGLDSLLQTWEKRVAAKKAHPQKGEGKRGPPGIETIEDFLAHANPDGEPVLEIAYLSVEPDAAIAMLAVRDRKGSLEGDAPGINSFLAKVRAVVAEPILEELHWSPLSIWDVDASAILEKLTAKALNLGGGNGNQERRNEIPNPLPRLGEMLGPDYQLILMVQGESALREVERWGQDQAGTEKYKIMGIYQARTCREFFAWLGSTIYRLRERWSCPGLLPLHWMLRGGVEEWATSERDTGFFYEFDPKALEIGLLHCSALWYYHAGFQALFHMNRGMWSRVQWRDEFSLKVLGRRLPVKATALDEVGSRHDVEIRILPGLSVEIELASKSGETISSKKLPLLVRDRLRQKGAAPRFVYATRFHDLDALAKVVNPNPGENIPDGFDQIPAVLIPRHFVVTNDSLPVRDMANIANLFAEGVFRRPFIVGDECKGCFVLHVPSLIAGIRRAYENNAYGDYLYWLSRQLSHGANEAKVFPDGLWKCISTARLNHYRPSYWCLDPERNGNRSEDDLRWTHLHHLQEWADGAGVNFDFLSQPSREEGFKRLIEDCDADFLIRGLSGEDRTIMDQLFNRWIECIWNFIGQNCDLGGNLKDCIHDALVEFALRCRRMQRRAIEVAQRCSLAGLAPTALVIEPEGELLAKWHDYLGLAMRGKIMKKRPKAEPVAATEQTLEDVAASEGMHVDAALDEEEDVDVQAHARGMQLAELLTKLMSQPPTRGVALEFANYVRAGGRPIWKAALSDLDLSAKAAEILVKAKTLAQQMEKNEKLLPELIKCLGRLRRTRKAG